MGAQSFVRSPVGLYARCKVSYRLSTALICNRISIPLAGSSNLDANGLLPSSFLSGCLIPVCHFVFLFYLCCH